MLMYSVYFSVNKKSKGSISSYGINRFTNLVVDKDEKLPAYKLRKNIKICFYDYFKINEEKSSDII